MATDRGCERNAVQNLNDRTNDVLLRLRTEVYEE